MQIMEDNDYKLFKTIAGLSQKSLLKCMKQVLENKYNEIIATDDYICAIGDIPIALVAHLDTVFTRQPINIYYDREQGVLWSPQGLGADDRAGVFAILKIIQTGARPTIILTTDEEKGCLGSAKLVTEYQVPITELKYIIQLDRRGTVDCVFYDCDNKDFIKYVENFGFKENIGSFTDISYLCPVWGVAGVNLSVGYENEHNEIETLSIVPLYATINKVKNMLNEKDIPYFPYIPTPSTTKWYNDLFKVDASPTEDDFDFDFNFDDENDDSIFTLHDMMPCCICGEENHAYAMIPAEDSEGEIDIYCGDCAVTLIDWCEECGDSYVKNDEPSRLCYKCRKKRENNYVV